jgi:DNA repair exonuclease SbcCD ATPase subunit
MDELRGIAGGLWEDLAKLQLLEGVPPETAGLEPDGLREAMDETDAALRNGIDAEQRRRSEITSRLRKEQLRRAITSGFVSLFGLLVVFLGILGARLPIAIGGVLLLAAGAGGLISLPLLRRSYRRAFSRLPDLEKMRDKLKEFERLRAGVNSKMGWVAQLLPRERKLHDGKTEAEEDLENSLRRAGAEGDTLEELKKTHTQLQGRRRERESIEARLREAKKRLAELKARGGAEELMDRIKEKRNSLPAIDKFRLQYRDGEDYIEKERAAREDAGKLEAELEGLRSKAQAMLKCATPPGKLRSEIARLRADEAKLLRFRESLDTARNVLASVVEDTHARWSASLNQSASEIVERLTQARYSRVVFDNDLSPTLERPDGRQIMEGQALRECLSEGTQDLLYFAARVTVARELSSSREPLPLILDDPLVALDESRLQEALSLLAKMARQVQVIILACRERYKAGLQSLSEREGTDFAYIHLA